MTKSFAVYALAVFACVFAGYSCKGRKAAEIEGMVHIPSGEFYMGSRGTPEMEGMDAGDGRIGPEVGVTELPRHAVSVRAFYLDRYEVTMSQYKKFVDATGHRPPDNPAHPYDPYIWKNGVYPAGMEDNPVVLVSYEDAAGYCKWAGKRPPSEEEWERACRGDDGRWWPWGNQSDVTKANRGELQLNRSTPVGSFPLDVSPYGVYDMAGNVREWTSSIYTAYPGSTLKADMFGENEKAVRGGSWLHPSTPYGRCAGRTSSLPELLHRSRGFRCAMDGE